VVGPAIKVNIAREIPPSDEQVSNYFRQITNNGGVSRRAAVTQVAEKYKRSPKEIYSAIERMKKLGE
jgi:hypothetical protein